MGRHTLDALGLKSTSAIRLWMILIHGFALAGGIWARVVGIGAFLGGLIFGSFWITIIQTAVVSPNLQAASSLASATGALIVSLKAGANRAIWLPM